MNPIYLDYNATTPLAVEVIEMMRPYIEEHFGNPSSSHSYGVTAKTAIERARQQVADLLGCSNDEIVFTSGGSESNNYAICGAAMAHMGNHIITSKIEHPAVLKVCHHLEWQGYQVTYLPVDEYGLVDVRSVEEAIQTNTMLITIMHANNEVGTIQPIAEIANLARKYNIIFHTDAAQSIGKIATRVNTLNVDLLSLAGHKLYAPKGVGALYVRDGVKLEKLVHGASHEKNRRAGTENVASIVGFGMACQLVHKANQQEYTQLKKMRDSLFNKISERIPEIRLNGHPEARLPNTLSICFPGVEANALLNSVPEVAASAGAACHSGTVNMSHVLVAMGISYLDAMGTVRLSLGKMSTEDEVNKAAELLISAFIMLNNTQNNHA